MKWEKQNLGDKEIFFLKLLNAHIYIDNLPDCYEYKIYSRLMEDSIKDKKRSLHYSLIASLHKTRNLFLDALDRIDNEPARISLFEDLLVIEKELIEIEK